MNPVLLLMLTIMIVSIVYRFNNGHSEFCFVQGNYFQLIVRDDRGVEAQRVVHAHLAKSGIYHDKSDTTVIFKDRSAFIINKNLSFLSSLSPYHFVEDVFEQSVTRIGLLLWFLGGIRALLRPFGDISSLSATLKLQTDFLNLSSFVQSPGPLLPSPMLMHCSKAIGEKMVFLFGHANNGTRNKYNDFEFNNAIYT